MMKKTLAIGLLLTTSACAELTSIYHTRDIPVGRARIVTMDAKQRNVLMVPSSDGNSGTTWRMCAEAAPDAFSALSASGSLTADIKSQSGKAAVALAETAGTIERTQTINLLRESMYRTCERYLSGALTQDQFIIQAARDQKSMVAILAIEQLTRAARPAATILTPSGTSSFVANGEEQAALIAKFVKERDDAQAAEADAQRAFTAVAADCKDLPIPPAGADETTTAKWSTCNVARGQLADRVKDLTAAADRLDKLLDTMGGTAGLPAGAGASTIGGVPQGGGGQADNAADLTRIAEAVETIASVNGIDESLMFCVAYLTNRKDRQHEDIVPACLAIIKERAKNDEALRSNVLSFQLHDGDVTVTSAARDSRAARRTLTNYVSSGNTKAEKERRLDMVGKAATALVAPRHDVPSLILGSRAAEILAALRILETDPAGSEILNQP